MATVTIEIPDDVLEVVRAKAEAQGLTLEAWFRQLVDQDLRRGRYTLEELVERCDPQAPLSAEDREWL